MRRGHLSGHLRKWMVGCQLRVVTCQCSTSNSPWSHSERSEGQAVGNEMQACRRPPFLFLLARNKNRQKSNESSTVVHGQIDPVHKCVPATPSTNLGLRNNSRVTWRRVEKQSFPRRVNGHIFDLGGRELPPCPLEGESVSPKE